MKRLSILLAVLLWAGQALAAPPKQPLTATYVPYTAATADLQQLDYHPGMVTLTWKNGHVEEVPVWLHVPSSPDHAGVVVLLPDPNRTRDHYQALVYQPTRNKQALKLKYTTLRGTANTVAHQAHQLATTHLRGGNLYLTTGLKAAWEAMPTIVTDDREATLGALWEVPNMLSDGYQGDIELATTFWLVRRGYNPMSSGPVISDWLKANATDDDVRRLLEAMGR